MTSYQTTNLLTSQKQSKCCARTIDANLLSVTTDKMTTTASKRMISTSEMTVPRRKQTTIGGETTKAKQTSHTPAVTAGIHVYDIYFFIVDRLCCLTIMI